MSMLPLKLAPSVMLTVGAKMLPHTFAVSFTNTDFSACRSPSTVPSTMMSCALDIRLDGALRADGQALRVGNRALHAALDQQIFFGASDRL